MCFVKDNFYANTYRDISIRAYNNVKTFNGIRTMKKRYCSITIQIFISNIYEEKVKKLEQENFNLRLRIHFMEGNQGLDKSPDGKTG